MTKSGIKLTIFAFCSLILFPACAGYTYHTKSARAVYNSGKFDEAAELYKKGEIDSGADRLLYLMDSGLSHFFAGNYKEAITQLTAADELSDRLETLSLSREASSFIATDYMIEYPGEDYERILINTYLSLSYLAIGQYEEAMVEARMINEKISEFNKDEEKRYSLNAFSIYLSGILYEMLREPSEAYIDYKKVYSLTPGLTQVRKDLLRLSKKLAYTDDYKSWKEEFSESEVKSTDQEKKGELIVFFHCGLSPQKRQAMREIAIPVYKRRPSFSKSAEIFIGPDSAGETQIIENIESTAIAQLDSKMARILLKQTAVTAGKVAIAKGIGNAAGSKGLGDLILLFFYATNEADTRSWLTLPGNLQIARIPIDPGKYDIRIVAKGIGGQIFGEVNYPETVIDEKLGKAFLNFRSTK